MGKGRSKERCGLESQTNFFLFKKSPKTECGLDSRIYCIFMVHKGNFNVNCQWIPSCARRFYKYNCHVNVCLKEIQCHLHNFGILLFVRYRVQKGTVYGTLVLIIFHRILFKYFVCLRFQIIHKGLKRTLQIIFISSCICHQRVCMGCVLKMFNKTGNVHIM